MENIPTTTNEMFKAFKDMMPKVTATATGYEIRTKLIEMAQTQAFTDYNFKLGSTELKSEVNGDEVVQTVSYQGADEVMKIANQFLTFVNKKD